MVWAYVSSFQNGLNHLSTPSGLILASANVKGVFGKYRKCIGNPILKKTSKQSSFSHKKEYLEPSRTLGKLKIGQDGHKLGLSRFYAAIFEIFTFGRFLAFFVKKNTFFAFFRFRTAGLGRKRAKIQNLKNRRIKFRETQFMSILANFQLPKCSRWL